MNAKFVLCAGALASAAVMLGQAHLYALADGSKLSRPGSARAGDPMPDLVVFDIAGVRAWGTFGDTSAYSIGTNACNNGNTLLSWRDSGANANQHPVIAQNIYRLMDGHFEQIGMSWAKHGFCAADAEQCGECDPSPGCDWLGVGCSDAYDASTNGINVALGPRSEVNPVTGFFPFPFSSPSGDPTLAGRIQIPMDDLDPELNPDVQYFGEGHYITPDDAGGLDDNNIAWRPMFVTGWNEHGWWHLAFMSQTAPLEPAINAWAANVPEVELTEVHVPDDGLFILGSRCADNGDGTWHYEYALYNMNSDRSGQSFSIPLPDGAAVSNIEFRDVDSHSGEPYSTADWSHDIAPNAITWSTDSYDEDEFANALRWGTLYNFRFDADVEPGETNISVGLFKPGVPDSMMVSTCGPATPSIPADLDGDGDVDSADLAILLASWGPCPGCPADLDGDGDVDSADLAILLASWT